MHARLRSCLLACCLSVPSAFAQDTSGAAPQPRSAEIQVELNKLEPVGSACRGYFVVNNGQPEPIKELRLDVFLFDRAGIILRRFGLTFLDIRAERSKVVLFDLPEVSCNDVGRMVVNDVIACTAASGSPLPGCASKLRTSTRANASFTY